MTAGSRKRRRPDGRLASPPLAPSPLLTRNLQLLPVGLTQLPNDELFVFRLRNDIDDLLSAFAEAYLLSILTSNGHGQSASAASTSRDTLDAAQHVTSPFSVFTQVWQQKGWHYIHFTFADHTDSKRAMGDAICRVLLERLTPYITDSTGQVDRNDTTVSFADLKRLFTIMAVPFALYMFWCTQIYPTSGTGVKHCRPALERIPIEQDYYDLLLELPEAILTHLQEEHRTRSNAEAITADLIEVTIRLVGELFDEQTLQEALNSSQNPSTKPRKNAAAKPRASTKPPERLTQDNTMRAAYPDGIFDIIPASTLGTRLPTTWPSMRVMSTLEANKEFGRVGNIVRIRPRENDAGAFPHNQAHPAMSPGTAPGAAPTEVKEKVAGLSRGDVVRLKARQRLAMASADLSKLLPPSRDTQTLPTASSSQKQTSDLLAQTAPQSASAASSGLRARLEIETPSWMKNAKYTAKLKPWLEESSTPMQQSMERATDSKRRYYGMRSKIMPSDGASEADTAEGVASRDFGEWVLREFKHERRMRREREEEGVAFDGGRMIEDEAATLTRPDDDGTLTLDDLYQLAAERTKTAALERGETLKALNKPSKRSK